MESMILRNTVDAHMHFRDYEEMKLLIPYTKQQFAFALAMPNVNPPLTNFDTIVDYKIQLDGLAEDTQILYTFYLTDHTLTSDLHQCVNIIKGVKLYPIGTTTNSHNGVTIDLIKNQYKNFELMEENKIPLLIHAEMPGASQKIAEQKFVPIIENIIKSFPKLKIVVEHISSANMIDFVLKHDINGTITLHHLFLTEEDTFGNPFNYCRPIAKTEADRKTLIHVLQDGYENFFFGSDSAYHPIQNKVFGHKPGVFSAPVLIPLLVQVFEENDCLGYLRAFISERAMKFYELKETKEFKLNLIKESWRVPNSLLGIEPFYAGKEIKWKITN